MYFKNRYEENIDRERAIRRKYYWENREARLEYRHAWNKTPAGRQFDQKRRSERRELGHEPINEWFKGCDSHHLRYSATNKERDNDLVIYAPRKLHRSVWHNGKTGENMKAINMLLLEWYVENTSKEQRNPVALQLLKNYKELPEPVWKQ